MTGYEGRPLSELEREAYQTDNKLALELIERWNDSGDVSADDALQRELLEKGGTTWAKP